MEAPIRIVKIIVDTTAVFSEASFINLKFIFPFIRAIIKAPKAPMAAASVGVAMPAKIDPSTRKIKITGRASVFKISIFLIGASLE